MLEVARNLHMSEQHRRRAEALIELAREANDPASIAEVQKEYRAIQSGLADFELKMLLSGPNDRFNAFLTINSGAAALNAS